MLLQKKIQVVRNSDEHCDNIHTIRQRCPLKQLDLTQLFCTKIELENVIPVSFSLDLQDFPARLQNYFCLIR